MNSIRSHLCRVLGAVLGIIALLGLGATPSLAVATAITALSNASYTDLGAGPLTLGATNDIMYQIADSQPANGAVGFRWNTSSLPRDLQTTSHIWAKSMVPYTTNAITAPITASGGGGGGGGGAVTVADGSDAAEGATTNGPCTTPTTSSACTVDALLKSIANAATLVLSPAISASLGTSIIAKNAAGVVFGFYCSGIAGGAPGYCIVYNSATVPTTGALTGANVLDYCYFTGPAGCSLNRTPIGRTASAGVVALISSATSPYTYTTGVLTGGASVDVQ